MGNLLNYGIRCQTDKILNLVSNIIRFIDFFESQTGLNTDKDKLRAKKMGIKDLNKKYDLNEIVSGDSIFCATGITSGDLVSGIKIENDEFVSDTLITHKSSGLKKNIILKQKI